MVKMKILYDLEYKNGKIFNFDKQYNVKDQKYIEIERQIREKYKLSSEATVKEYVEYDNGVKHTDLFQIWQDVDFLKKRGASPVSVLTNFIKVFPNGEMFDILPFFSGGKYVLNAKTSYPFKILFKKDFRIEFVLFDGNVEKLIRENNGKKYVSVYVESYKVNEVYSRFGKLKRINLFKNGKLLTILKNKVDKPIVGWEDKNFKKLIKGFFRSR